MKTVVINVKFLIKPIGFIFYSVNISLSLLVKKTGLLGDNESISEYFSGFIHIEIWIILETNLLVCFKILSLYIPLAQ